MKSKKMAHHRKGRWLGSSKSCLGLCVSYFSHCCDKMSDTKQRKAGRACSGSQSEHAAHPGREGTRQEPQPRELQGGSSHLS